MNASAFDKLLSENCTTPEYVVVNWKIWNGYWSIKRRPKIISFFFRKLGRFLKNRNIYWVGLSIYWEYGLKEFFPEGIKPIYIEES